MSEVKPVSLFRLLGFGIIALGVVFLVSVYALSAWEQRACDSGLVFRMDTPGTLYSAAGEILDETGSRAAFDAAGRDGRTCATLNVHVDTDLGYVSNAQRAAKQAGVRLRVDFEHE